MNIYSGMEQAKPFLKWAGGKSQLLQEFDKRLPIEVKNGTIKKYIEPFVGGGAVFFYIAQKYAPGQSYIFDVNDELILTYWVVQRNVRELIEELRKIESNYHGLSTENQKQYYYQIRENFNKTKRETNFKTYQKTWVKRAIQIIFLNRTCYNGLYRVNSRGEFNVPFGKYKNPQILNEKNLIRASKILKNTHIHLGDFSSCARFVDKESFVYLDPPYRPLSETSSFTSYSEGNFSDDDQRRLAQFYKRMNKRGAKLMMSNSDPRNVNPLDDFFDQLYSEFTIERVPARRAICCNGSGRGDLNELIITNYSVKKTDLSSWLDDQE